MDYNIIKCQGKLWDGNRIIHQKWETLSPWQTSSCLFKLSYARSLFPLFILDCLLTYGVTSHHSILYGYVVADNLGDLTFKYPVNTG